MKLNFMALALLMGLGLASMQEAWSYNPPGAAGGPGHGKYWHHNPAGPRGGAGRGWIYNPPGPGRAVYQNYHNYYGYGTNPPGYAGGPGHGQFWHYNPAGPSGGRGRGWIYNPPGPGKVRFY